MEINKQISDSIESANDIRMTIQGRWGKTVMLKSIMYANAMNSLFMLNQMLKEQKAIDRDVALTLLLTCQENIASMAGLSLQNDLKLEEAKEWYETVDKMMERMLITVEADK